MNTPRFNYDRTPGAASRPRARKFPKWIRVTHVSGPLLRDSSGSGRRKIFAIVAPSTPADVGYKTIQHILIFDNHPDSLRLVFGRRANPRVDLATGRVRPTGGLAAPRHTNPSHVILGVVLVLVLVLGMFSPLF